MVLVVVLGPPVTLSPWKAVAVAVRREQAGKHHVAEAQTHAFRVKRLNLPGLLL